ncbi:TIGR03089 family protein [Rothia mucilaginosa]|uniref:TIGR03089 family protein n=1 Tax=Rothia mucilaginosa TaxID=43675 RepID=UPI00195DC9B2|nr:TIGR03089 family protein [Rothia mucilaginosa]VTY05797.1 TIGR03089: family protein [Rothia mucilaginosa]
MVTLSPTGPVAPASLNRFFETLSSIQTPALIWYSDDGERIELSGRVLMNWVNKAANLLIEECDLTADEAFDLQAPLHWRPLVVGLAALRVGVTLNQDEPLAAAVCTEQDAHFVNDPAYLLAVDRAPLALAYSGDLTALQTYADEVLDFCALVPSMGDHYEGLLPDESTEVIEGFTYSEAYAQIRQLADSYRGETLSGGQRALALMLSPSYGFDSSNATLSTLMQALAIMASGHAVFLADPAVEWSEERLTSLLEAERAKELPCS